MDLSKISTDEFLFLPRWKRTFLHVHIETGHFILKTVLKRGFSTLETYTMKMDPLTISNISTIKFQV